MKAPKIYCDSCDKFVPILNFGDGDILCENRHVVVIFESNVEILIVDKPKEDTG